MKKTILNAFVFSFIFAVVMLGCYIAVKARLPDTSWLTAQSWDVLTADKWNNLLPSTAITAFYATNCPTGWKPADGTNSTPDLRWQFLRWLNTFDGWSTTRSDGQQDPDWSARVLWSYQADDFKAHTHTLNGIALLDGWVNKFWYVSGWARKEGGWTTLSAWWTETRPKNTWIIYCMKK